MNGSREAKAQARFKELMKLRHEIHDKEIKAVNDEFLAGEMSLREMEDEHKAINKKTDAIATTMRAKVFKDFADLKPTIRRKAIIRITPKTPRLKR